MPRGYVAGMRDNAAAERLDRFAAAWTGCDLDELRGQLSDDVVYSPLWGERVRGTDAVVRRFAAVLADDASCAMTFERPVVSGSLGISRWRQSVPTGDGSAFVVHGIDVYRLGEDGIRCLDVYKKA
jgi:hypothetical protein